MRRCSALFATEARPTHWIRSGWRRISRCEIARVLAWADACWRSEAALPLLVYSTAEPAGVAAAHAQLGVARSGAIVEQAMSALARAFVQRGVGSLVVAGGETAGICVQALEIRQMQIGPQIDPGVPWCYALFHAADSTSL